MRPCASRPNCMRPCDDLESSIFSNSLGADFNLSVLSYSHSSSKYKGSVNLEILANKSDDFPRETLFADLNAKGELLALSIMHLASYASSDLP